MTKIEKPTRFQPFKSAGLGIICMMLSLSIQAYPGGGHTPGSGERITAELSLNESQQALLQAALQRPDKTEKHANGSKLRELIHAENYDVAAIEKIARSMSDTMYARIIERSQRMHTFYNSLSPTQKEQLTAIESQRRSKNHHRSQQTP